ALAPDIAGGEGFPLPHTCVALALSGVQTGRRFFWPLSNGESAPGRYCGAVFRASSEAGCSDVAAASGGPLGRMTGISRVSPPFSPSGLADTAATGCDCAAAAAWTAA